MPSGIPYYQNLQAQRYDLDELDKMNGCSKSVIYQPCQAFPRSCGPQIDHHPYQSHMTQFSGNPHNM